MPVVTDLRLQEDWISSLIVFSSYVFIPFSFCVVTELSPAINNHRKYSSYFLERMCGEGLEENLQKMCYRGAYLTSLCMKGGR